ncbi:hypothetical protein LMG23994_05579 [Cupriavidus pinatubonensis]|uniref:Uncharacterized protein n=1 Tax=Cupriavidus pinatubonensis TaxID=248026 RepID=A0ABM8XX91_9BURK|nr:hypothetical protein LMG23994_05579 [Cupriavidus pinatubonensis]
MLSSPFHPKSHSPVAADDSAAMHNLTCNALASFFVGAAARKPTEVLAENSSDRPDVASVAILGYN